MTSPRPTSLLSTLRGAFTDPDVRIYREHAQDTDQQLAALNDRTLDRLHTGARRAYTATSSATEQTQAAAFLSRLEQLMRDRAAGRPAPVTLEASDLVVAAMTLQALGELLEADELDVRGRTLRVAAALSAAAGPAAADQWYLEQTRADLARTLGRDQR